MDYAKEALRLHAEWKGKLDVNPKMEINTKDDLSLAYTPGVAAPCLEIEKDINKSYELTGRGNLVAVVTDGFSAWEISDRRQGCRSWRGNVFCLRSLAV